MAFRIQEQEVARKSTIGLGFLAGKVPSYRPFRQRGSVMHGFSDPGARSCAEKYHRIGISGRESTLVPAVSPARECHAWLFGSRGKKLRGKVPSDRDSDSGTTRRRLSGQQELRTTTAEAGVHIGPLACNRCPIVAGILVIWVVADPSAEAVHPSLAANVTIVVLAHRRIT